MKFLFYKSFLTLFVFVAAITALPAELLSQTENTIFRNITPDEGLPVTSVTGIAQDSYGYIWIGSWDGVYRYDGQTFEKKSPSGRYLEADQKGGVWIGYGRGGPVAYYNSVQDSLHIFDVNIDIDWYPRLKIDAAGRVWSESGENLPLLLFNESLQTFEPDSLQEPGLSFNVIAHADSSISFYSQNAEVEWGLGHRTYEGIHSFQLFPLDQNNPDPSLRVDATQVAFRGYKENGLLLVNEFGWATRESLHDDWRFVKSPDQDLLKEVSDAIVHKDDLWVHKTNALVNIDLISGEFKIYTHNPLNPKSLLAFNQNNAGSQLFIDRQDVLWIPSFVNGISRLNLYASDFGLLRYEDGTPIRDVISAVELEDGSFWIGARFEEDGLFHFDASGNIIEQYSGPFSSPPGRSVSTELSHPFVWSLAKASDGSIWAGTGSPGPDDGGLNRIRPGSDQITRFKHDPVDESSLYPGNWISKIVEDGSGRIWVKDWERMVWIDPYTEIITRYPHPEQSEVPEGEPFDMSETDSGDLIVSTESNRYYIIHHEDLRVEKINLRVEWDTHTSIEVQDPDGRFWVNNADGFGLVDSSLTTIEKWYDIERYDFPVNELSSIIFDEQGHAWLGTDSGIVKFDPDTEDVTHYPYQRGLQGHNFTGQVTYKGPSGKIYFGDSGGVNIFDPNQIQKNPHPPEMVFTDMTLDGLPVNFGENQTISSHVQSDGVIVIQPDISTIGLEFAALHFAGNRSNQYQYMLEGFDSDWRESGFFGQAAYTNLSPGDYIFKIRGSNLDGVWSDGTDSLFFNVLPPWYQTWWAYGFYLILLIAGIVTADRIQRKRVQQKEREKAREKELAQAREIEKAYKNLEVAHEDLKAVQDQLIQQEKLASLGQLTAGIAHEIKNPLNFVNNFSDLSLELVEEIRSEIRDMRSSYAKASEHKNVKGPPSEASAKDGEKETVKSEKTENPSASRRMDCDPSLDGNARGLSDGASDESFDPDLMLDILNDIELNLKTIHKHGSRADSIVKSMLQHSRGGEGKMEPTALNALIKEYVNLAFHGMRAGENPINVDIDLQLDDSIGEVHLASEDFSRVILNLSNNAFDAMREKANVKRETAESSFEGGKNDKVVQGDASSDDYIPKLTVVTHQKDQFVTIEIKDNGPGIPEEIKEKILQPFFTTKKGTQGTGLGLSITNDIIKAHGGDLGIHSTDQGTSIRITISK